MNLPQVRINMADPQHEDVIQSLINVDKIQDCIVAVVNSLRPSGYGLQSMDHVRPVKRINLDVEYQANGPPAFVVHQNEEKNVFKLMLNAHYVLQVKNRFESAASATKTEYAVVTSTVAPTMNNLPKIPGIDPHQELVYEVIGVICHELTHVFQWDGRDNSKDDVAEWWFIEGIADYVRLHVNYAARHWCEDQCRRERNGYAKGYQNAGYFFKWLNEKFKSDVVQRWNANLMAVGWKESFPVEIAQGGGLEQLHQEYCTKKVPLDG
ncbi:hypothetical protein MP228_011356 [Amoeboaphelidium protococcarum]|nr:hypothetical protein MP228_011356 [Amoeboaphelidium protococcarum]